mmetsp:Transcript_25056/g.48008  ORF Transcript_25056/g.48008 Transcript_25056/m.48008 type:complete len:93 (+) Transcript_25056:87-365(+)
MALAPKKATQSKQRVMKAKRVSKIARGRMAKALVLRGKHEKTAGGLRADGLMKNKRGKVVSKRQSAQNARKSKGQRKIRSGKSIVHQSKGNL